MADCDTSCLDYTQILPRVYDPETCSLRTTAQATIITPPAIEVSISHLDDSIKIGDGVSNFVAVNADGSINVRIVQSSHNTPIFDEAAGTITTAAFTQVYSYTSTDSNTRIMNVECTCSTPATFRLKIDGVIKRVQRSSPGQRNVSFQFDENRPLNSASVLSVEANVERLILASYSTFTSLQGYIE